LLVALAVYDLVAVLAPGGPLKLLVELASTQEKELPTLIYEARPTVSRNTENRGSLPVTTHPQRHNIVRTRLPRRSPISILLSQKHV